VAAVQLELLERDEELRQLKLHLQKAQSYMKIHADTHRTERNFEVADWVFLKLRPHRQKTVASCISGKLATRYYWPY